MVIRLIGPRNVRVSLTLWYIAAMTVILAVYAAVIYVFVSRNSSTVLNERLRDDYEWAAAMADLKPDGTLTWFDQGGGTMSSPWLTVWSEGHVIFRTSAAERNPLPEAVFNKPADQRILVVPTEIGPVRLLMGTSRIFGKPVVLAVARSETAMRREIQNLLVLLLLGLPLGIAIAGAGGYVLAYRALAPIDRMASRARTITAERLGERLPVDNPNDEIGRLATVFNDTLERLEASFAQMRQFTADVSHELRTPLTAMKSVGEIGLRGRRDAADYRTVIGSMLEEVDRLAGFIDRLLILSRAAADDRAFARDPIDLRDLAQEVASQLSVLAEEKQQTLVIEPAGTARAVGDRVMLRQAVINLVDNAIKYAPDGAAIRMRVSEAAATTVLDVSDTGPGIPASARAHIFERFHRGDTATGPGRPTGAGLGLSIAKWAVEANGGSLTLQNAAEGCTFRIALPTPCGPSTSAPPWPRLRL